MPHPGQSAKRMDCSKVAAHTGGIDAKIAQYQVERGGNVPIQPRSGLIGPSDLASKHVISFTRQPYLRALFEALRTPTTPLALVVGAGVSMNAGLPSWAALLDNIVDLIEDPELKVLAKEYEGDALRRAEFILQLARRKNLNATMHEFIRDGLFPRETSPTPGPLARSIARLVAVRRGVASVITTNFDELIEDALKEIVDPTKVKAFTLSQTKEWKLWRDSGNFGVLHVHGILRQAGEDSEANRDLAVQPVILTESQFLKNGSAVRAAISEGLENAVGLFVGLSMTDPNLVGPLHEQHRDARQYPLFALSVATLPSEQHLVEKHARFAVESVRFLDGKLNLRPILLKSRSQVDQVLSDLALASAEPKFYLRAPRGGKNGSLYYGHRADRAIKLCYEAIGCFRAPYVPSGDAATKITDTLRAALTRRGGPQAILRKTAERLGVQYAFGQENFGLHLWLRRLDRDAECPTYSLALVGSSAYEARDSWFARRNISIVQNTPYAAAQAVFEGNYVATNLNESANGGVWRGVVAIPIEIVGTTSPSQIGGQPLDRITVGALTLDSDHFVEESAAVRADPELAKRLGVISKLGRDDTLALRKALYETVSRILATGPTT